MRRGCVLSGLLMLLMLWAMTAVCAAPEALQGPPAANVVEDGGVEMVAAATAPSPLPLSQGERERQTATADGGPDRGIGQFAYYGNGVLTGDRERSLTPLPPLAAQAPGEGEQRLTATANGGPANSRPLQTAAADGGGHEIRLAAFKGVESGESLGVGISYQIVKVTLESSIWGDLAPYYDGVSSGIGAYAGLSTEIDGIPLLREVLLPLQRITDGRLSRAGIGYSTRLRRVLFVATVDF